MNIVSFTDAERAFVADLIGSRSVGDRVLADRVLAAMRNVWMAESDRTELVLDIWIDGIPMTKGSWKIFRRKLIPDNPGEPEWAAAIGWVARAKLRNAPAVKARYLARMEFHLPQPVGHKLYRRDLDKLARSAFDALEGIVWTNDEQVEQMWCRKARGNTPGARIIVERIGG